MKSAMKFALVAASVTLSGLVPGFADAAKVTLMVSHVWVGPALAIQAEFDKQFMKKHPNIIVKSDYMDWVSCLDKSLIRFATGTAPDVMYTFGGHAQLWAKRGLLMDLTPLIKQTKDFNLVDFPKRALRWYSREGRLYALPMDWSIIPIWYNKSLFKQAGLE